MHHGASNVVYQKNILGDTTLSRSDTMQRTIKKVMNQDMQRTTKYPCLSSFTCYYKIEYILGISLYQVTDTCFGVSHFSQSVEYKSNSTLLHCFHVQTFPIVQPHLLSCPLFGLAQLSLASGDCSVRLLAACLARPAYLLDVFMPVSRLFSSKHSNRNLVHARPNFCGCNTHTPWWWHTPFYICVCVLNFNNINGHLCC